MRNNKKTKDLKYYKDLDYNVILKKRKNRFILLLFYLFRNWLFLKKMNIWRKHTKN